jgi:2'-5' RNA ligase
VSEEIRTFIAVEVKNTDVLRKLIEVRDLLLTSNADLKPVEDENIHLTLRFIGEIPLSLARAICTEISSIRAERFQVHVKGIGAFPSLLRPRVVWAGVEEGSDKLRELYAVIEERLKRLGIPREREEFIPHITLARIKSSKNIDKLVKLLSDLVNVDFGFTVVDEVFVKKSVLTPSGPLYSNICSVKLA